MKIPTTDDIKEILKVELEKSKRHVQHYYLVSWNQPIQ